MGCGCSSNKVADRSNSSNNNTCSCCGKIGPCLCKLPPFALKPDAEQKAKQENNVENVVVVWLNPSANDQNAIKKMQDGLQKVANVVLTYSDPDECQQLIESVKNEKVFLVVSDGVQETFVSNAVANLTQIDSVYQYTPDKKRTADLSNKIPGIHKPHTELSKLCDAMKDDIKTCNKNLIGFTFVSETPLKLEVNDEITTENNQLSVTKDPSVLKQSYTDDVKDNGKYLYRQDSVRRSRPWPKILIPSMNDIATNPKETPFMYIHLFKEIIMTLTDDKDMDDLYDLVRENYKGNNEELQFLNELQTTYHKKTPAHWYSKEACLYKMLNKALRTYDFEKLCKMRVFIHDLHEQLSAEQIKTESEDEEITLYRGQAMDKKEFDSDPPKEGKFMHISNFLSTSSDRNVADGFAGKTVDKPNLYSFLMEIKVKKNIPVPFANITKYSVYGKEEKELLFSIGSVFRVVSIKMPSHGEIGHIGLVLVDHNDPELTALQKYLKTYMADKNGYLNIARLMYHLGKWEKAAYFYNLALNRELEDDWQRRASILNNLGSICTEQEDLRKALDYYKEALELEISNGGENHLGLASTYNNIGTMYYRLKETSLADINFNKAVKIHDYNTNNDRELTATIFSNIALVRNDKHEHEEALDYLEKSLMIYANILPDIHPALAITYNCIAVTSHYLGRSAKKDGNTEKEAEYRQAAVQYAEKAVDMDMKSLPEDHPQTKLHKKNLEHFQNLSKSNS